MPASHHNHPEADERTPAECSLINRNGVNWANYPPEWQTRIERVARMQELLQKMKALGMDWSDREFAAEPKGIKNVWASLRLGLYPLPSSASKRTKWIGLLTDLEGHAKANLLRVNGAGESAESGGRYVERNDCKAIKKAIQRAHERASVQNPDRVVSYVADTGWGKSAMIKHLLDANVINWSVEATPAWSKSYKALLLSLAEMWSLDTDDLNELEMETRILKHARTLTGVVAMDELDTLNRQGWGLVKRLLNESRLVIALFMTPQTQQEIMQMARQRTRVGSQLKQFLRRFEITIKAASITPEEVPVLNPAFQGAAPAHLHEVAREANAMGGIDAVFRIGLNVSEATKGGKQLSEERFSAAVEMYRKAVPVIVTKVERRAA